MELNELKRLMKEAGIVGAGGAGFPSYAKLAAGADTLLVNGSECEPLLYTDYYLLRQELPTVIAGIRVLMETAAIPRALLCIKQHTAERLGLIDGAALGEKIAVKSLPNAYPVGDEVSLIYEATGRIVKPGNLPITAGCIVFNAETVYNVAKAAEGPVTMKWLTVGGQIPEAYTLRVPVGTPVASLFAKLHITVPEDCVVLDGGPSMGNLIDPARAVVSKTTKGILILPEDCEAVRAKKTDVTMSVARAETACCQCTHCTDVCPRALLGYPLEPHKLVRTARAAIEELPALAVTATLCCGCGLCTSLACCQGISPKAVIDHYKSLLAKTKTKYISSAETEAAPEREYRMIPAERWARSLGVKKFDKLPVFRGEMRTFSRLEIPLSRHIGAPSRPIVKSGDPVTEGQQIATGGEGLSVSQAAPMSGVVTLTETRIIIEKRN